MASPLKRRRSSLAAEAVRAERDVEAPARAGVRRARSCASRGRPAPAARRRARRGPGRCASSSVPVTEPRWSASTFRCLLRTFSDVLSGAGKTAGAADSTPNGARTGAGGVGVAGTYRGILGPPCGFAYGVSCRAHGRRHANGTHVLRALPARRRRIRPIRPLASGRQWVPRSPPSTGATRRVEQLFGDARCA